MKLSFDDEESFKEAVGSLRFNNPPSDPNTLQPIESIPSQDSETNDDPNILRRVGSSNSINVVER